MANINDPIDISLDADGDWDLSANVMQFTTGVAAVAQGVRLAVTLFRGEWFLDLERGMPYFTDILGQKFNKDEVLDTFRKEILAVPDVQSIPTLDAEYSGQTRTLTVTFTVLTPWGETSPQVVEI